MPNPWIMSLAIYITLMAGSAVASCGDLVSYAYDKFDLYDQPGGRVVRTVAKDALGEGKRIQGCRGNWLRISLDGNPYWVKQEQVKVDYHVSSNPTPTRRDTKDAGTSGMGVYGIR